MQDLYGATQTGLLWATCGGQLKFKYYMQNINQLASIALLSQF